MNVFRLVRISACLYMSPLSPVSHACVHSTHPLHSSLDSCLCTLTLYS